jgi:3-deoxy-7-phosphoheptulonate synthase
MNYQNDDLRIKEINELLPPVALLEKFPATENAANTVSHARKAIHKILKGNDDRLLVVIGPCSIHDPVAAKEYAARLLTLREELKGELEIVMRVYFEKPRTTVGWKGLINDPHMDNSFQIADISVWGSRLAPGSNQWSEAAKLSDVVRISSRAFQLQRLLLAAGRSSR